MYVCMYVCMYVLYLLKISLHLELSLPLKHHLTFQWMGANKHHPQNVAAWWWVDGVQSTPYVDMFIPRMEDDDEVEIVNSKLPISI